jgi:hypothetical protein
MPKKIKLYNTSDIVLDTAGKYCVTDIEVSISDSSLQSKNIVKDRTILGVSGELTPVELTNDATVDTASILKGKTA